MTARLTAAEARALGLIPKPATTKSTRRELAKGCLPNICTACGERFTGETAERRHSEATGHARFEAVL